MASGTRSRSGFQDGYVYKIMCMKDNKVIDVAGGDSSPEVKMIVKKSTGNPNQKFTAIKLDSGGFRISSVQQSPETNSPLQAWDFLPHNGLLMQNNAGDGMNQEWIAEEIIPNSKICIIKSKHDGRCLKNMGSGNQIKLVKEDRKDKSTHWRLEPTY